MDSKINLLLQQQNSVSVIVKDKVWKTHQNNSKLTNILTFNIKIVINRETILFGYREVFETFNKNSTLVIILITHS